MSLPTLAFWNNAYAEEATATFVAPGQTLNLPKTVPSLSPDKMVVTHKLEDATAEIGGKSGPDADTCSVSVHSILAKHDKPVRIRQMVRGYVNIDPGVKGYAMLLSGGKTTLIPLPESNEGDIKMETESVIESDTHFVATICLVLQRNSTDHEVKGLLTIDTLEFTIVEPSATKQAAPKCGT